MYALLFQDMVVRHVVIYDRVGISREDSEEKRWIDGFLRPKIITFQELLSSNLAMQLDC